MLVDHQVGALEEIDLFLAGLDELLGRVPHCVAVCWLRSA